MPEGPAKMPGFARNRNRRRSPDLRGRAQPGLTRCESTFRSVRNSSDSWWQDQYSDLGWL